MMKEKINLAKTVESRFAKLKMSFLCAFTGA